MALRVPLVNFTKGEVSEDIVARLDVQAYNASLKSALNVIIRKQGGIQNRMGLEHVGEVRDSGLPARLIPFQFSNTQAYAMEFGNASMRLAAQGGLVLEEELAITNISNAAQAVITAAYHGYSVGDSVYLTGVQGMTGVNGRTVRVLYAVDANNFVVDLNTLSSGTFVSASGGTVRTGPPPPPPGNTPPAPPSQPTPPPAPPPTTPGGGGGPDPLPGVDEL